MHRRGRCALGGSQWTTRRCRGFLSITDSLQSVADDRVFGAGDIATQVNHPRPKAGVYAVRQGPVLAHNLRAALLGKPLREHKPQHRFLSLVSLGDRQATADRGPFSATGAWVWRWKDSIDRKFMARFERLPTSMPRGSWGSVEDPGSALARHPAVVVAPRSGPTPWRGHWKNWPGSSRATALPSARRMILPLYRAVVAPR